MPLYEYNCRLCDGGFEQPQPMSAPKAREGPALGQRRELGGGGGDDDQLGRGLAQIDRLRAVGDLTGLGEEQVHQVSRFSMKTLLGCSEYGPKGPRMEKPRRSYSATAACSRTPVSSRGNSSRCTIASASTRPLTQAATPARAVAVS